MSSSEPLMQCVEPTCQFEDNPLGQRVCLKCEMPLRYRYLWAAGPNATNFAAGQQVGDRYYVMAAQVWLDLRPAEPPETPDPIPEAAQLYMRTHPYRLHLPEVYDVWQDTASQPIVLLDNVPFNAKGVLRPTLAAQWETAPAVRQLYWLWQILELWQPLSDLGAAYSLLEPENLRIEGWRIRLRELLVQPAAFARSSFVPSLQALAECWLTLIPAAQPPVMQPLQQLCDYIRAEAVTLEDTRKQINQLLLQQAAELPLRLTVSGATTKGPQRSHNEDSCYPDVEELRHLPPNDPSRVPQLAIVCDGIGGHEGGEVASQLAVRSLRPQMQALLNEIAEQQELVSPETIMEQMEAAIRVTNNLIASRNEGRSLRQRMGTTLVMALVVPQKVWTRMGWNYAHELYIAHVGDSRAYWITPDGCHLLTVDDVIASREMQLVQRFYAAALQHPESQALTQALGTREGDYLYPHLQRFVVEEDGVLLLCSDGLSDSDRVEQSWGTYIALITREMMPLETAVSSWIDLANQQNGHDNASVVLMHCHLTAPHPQVAAASEPLSTEETPETEFTEASKALLYGEGDEETVEDYAPISDRETSPPTLPRWLDWTIRILVVISVTSVVGLVSWWQLSRSDFQPDSPPEPLDTVEPGEE